MAAKEIVYLRGKLFWAKVLGEPVDNYNKDGKEWVFDLALDDDGVKQAKALKVLNIKDKDDDRGKFITLKQKATRADGTPNQPIRVLDAAGKPWNEEQKLGNETVADVKFEIRDYGKGKYPGIYPRAIRVLDHKEFASQEFAPLASDDEFFGKASKLEKDIGYVPSKDEFLGHTADDDLNDDVPF